MVHLILFAAVILSVVGSEKSKVFTQLSFLLLFGFAALRYMYGNDYYSYCLRYKYIHNGGASPYDGEYLFTFLNRVCPSFYVLVALTSAAFLFIVYRLIVKKLPQEYTCLGVFIFLINPYLFLMNLSALRQNIALLLFTVAIYFSNKRQFIPYVLVIVVATLFHQSAWALLPVFFIANDKPVQIRTSVCVALLTIVLLFWPGLGTFVERIVAFFNNKNYSYYASQELRNSLRATLLTSVTFIYVLCNLHKLQGESVKYGKLCLISSGLGILAYRFSMFTRIQMYFELFSIIALPQIFATVQSMGPVVADGSRPLKSFWDCINKYALPLLIVIIYFLRYYSFFHNPMWSYYFDYRTIFSIL